MADEETWAEQLAARVTPDQSAEARVAVGSEQPAWARVMADRAAGRVSSPEDLAAVRAGAQKPRTEFERKLLERLGYEEGDTPPAA